MASKWTKRRLVDERVNHYMTMFSKQTTTSSTKTVGEQGDTVPFNSKPVPTVSGITGTTNYKSQVEPTSVQSVSSEHDSDGCESESENNTNSDCYIYSTSEYESNTCSSSDEDDFVSGCQILENTSNDSDNVFRDDLSIWSVKYNISHSALTSLLKLLSRRMTFLPKDARTLLRTDRKISTKLTAGGEYYHIGIAQGIRNELTKTACVQGSVISIQVNIDGLPLHKSTNMQLWPILGRLHNQEVLFGSEEHNCAPFVIGLYQGTTKPSSISEFLSDFVNEATVLENSGFTHGQLDCCHPFKIAAFVCDMPARSLIKCVKGHGAYGGCDRCTQHGSYNNKVTYPECCAPLRTDASFIEMTDEIHHIRESPLIHLNIGMVSNFVVDYMHLVCLGVVRKLISLWLLGPLKTRLGPLSKKIISDKLICCRAYMPTDFCRKPRPVTEFERWKATELRSFVLYTGPVCLLDVLPPELYNNFILLSLSITILLSENLCTKYLDYAKQLLVLFVQHFSQIYGPDYVTYNVHALVHLHEDAARYGSLDKVSAFPFENYLGQLKKLIRQPKFPLQQLVRRISEKQLQPTDSNVDGHLLSGSLAREHRNGPTVSCLDIDKQFEQVKMGKFLIKLSERDRHVRLNNGNVVAVCNIVTDRRNVVYLLYKKFHLEGSLYSYPIPSSHVGIFEFNHLSINLHYCHLQDVQTKYVILPYKAKFIGFPLLHTE